MVRQDRAQRRPTAARCAARKNQRRRIASRITRTRIGHRDIGHNAIVDRRHERRACAGAARCRHNWRSKIAATDIGQGHARSERAGSVEQRAIPDPIAVGLISDDDQVLRAVLRNAKTNDTRRKNRICRQDRYRCAGRGIDLDRRTVREEDDYVRHSAEIIEIKADNALAAGCRVLRSADTPERAQIARRERHEAVEPVRHLVRHTRTSRRGIDAGKFIEDQAGDLTLLRLLLVGHLHSRELLLPREDAADVFLDDLVRAIGQFLDPDFLDTLGLSPSCRFRIERAGLLLETFLTKYETLDDLWFGCQREDVGELKQRDAMILKQEQIGVIVEQVANPTEQETLVDVRKGLFETRQEPCAVRVEIG